MKILSGDVGGTNTRLALLNLDRDGIVTRVVKTYSSHRFPSLSQIVEHFIRETGARPEAAGFGIAGPIDNRTCRTTNLPWTVDAEAMERELKIPLVTLINDLEATAWGLEALSEADLCTLQTGAEEASGNRSVIAAGTGLGQSGLYWDGERHHPFSTEGGHADFAPRTSLELALLQYLQEKFGRVSWERLISGPGIVNIQRFFHAHQGTEPPEWLSAIMKKDDPATAITRAALEGSDPVCRETLELFMILYGREAGNQALKQMAKGGVYIAGGIAPRILELLKAPPFMEAFLDKGRMRPLMTSMPVKVILNEKAALYGAALCAARR